jgi:endonuclease G
MKKLKFLLVIAFVAATISSCEKENIQPSQPTHSDQGSGGGGTGGCSTVQCSAYTQAGNRCQRMTTNCNGRCYQHQ